MSESEDSDEDLDLGDAGRGRGRGRGRSRGGRIPNPSSLKEKQVSLAFPFMLQRSCQSGDPVDKFSSMMDPRCVRAFAVFGPLRCLHSAFTSFQGTHQESKYRGMFQQIFPSLAHIAGLRSRILDMAQAPVAGVQLIAGDPRSENASEASAALFRLEPEYALGRGRADFVLRTISKKALMRFMAENKEIRWDNPDKEALANEVFDTIAPEYLRNDAVIDCKTDSVNEWKVKTRAQLAHYGNQLCLENLQNGFAPRPVYLIAIDATRWRLAVLDPYGVIVINSSRKIEGFPSFDEQQKLRADWIKKKDPNGAGYFASPPPWTEGKLQERLEHVNKLLMDRENVSGVKPDKYVVSNIWNAQQVFIWNGSGLNGTLLAGSLVLCEGLLRLACGDKVCKSGWTAQRLRMVFGRQHEQEISRCLQFERDLTVPQQRSLLCSYSENVIAAVVAGLETMPSDITQEFRQGFINSIEAVRGYFRGMAIIPATASQFQTLGRLYGGEEFLELLDDEARSKIGTSIRHLTVDHNVAEDDAAKCFEGLVISVKHTWSYGLQMVTQDYAVLLCDDMSILCRFWHKLFLGSYARLVVFAVNVDKEARHLLKDVERSVAILKVSSESLNALRTCLNIELVDNQAANFVSCVKDATKIVMCRNEVIVYCPAKNQSLSNILELQVSGATRNHFDERVQRIQTAATAINSSIAKGLVAGKGVAFASGLWALDASKPENYSADYVAGANIVKNALRVVLQLARFSKSVEIAHYKARIFQMSSESDLDIGLERGEVDLLESAEETLDKLLKAFHYAVAVVRKRVREEGQPSVSCEKKTRSS